MPYNTCSGKKGAYQGALDHATAQLELQAPRLHPKWVFKPRAETDVLPHRPGGSVLQTNFVSSRPSLTEPGHRELMECFDQNLLQAADLVEKHQSSKDSPEVAASIEQMLPHSVITGAALDHFGKGSKQHLTSQSPPDKGLRSKSAPNSPSSSEDFSDLDIDVDSLMKDIDIDSGSAILAAETRPKQHQADASVEDSPDMDFHTPPTTPALGAEAMVSNGNTTMKPPLSIPPKRKRPFEDLPKNPAPCKASRENGRRSSNDLKTSLSVSTLNDSPSSSFMSDITRSTVSTASSTFTSPNTSFSSSSAYSRDSKNTSFDFSSDTDTTIRPLPEAQFAEAIVMAVPVHSDTSKAEVFPNVSTESTALSKEARSQQAIVNDLRSNSPFGMYLSYDVTLTITS